ncbi:MAG: hypothetical protein AAFX79_12625 [Planctomycetota bacterium]
MNLGQFFEHWKISENPFRGEEARHDSVLARLALHPGVNGRTPAGARHSDFEKILGELTRPSTSIVFGEKGSGKTALRLQIEAQLRERNKDRPDDRILLIPYDDLNGVIDRFHARSGKADPLESLRLFRLVDHIDAMLLWVVPRLVDGVLQTGGPDALELSPGGKRGLRKLDASTRRDLLLLQTVYDRPESADLRTGRLRTLLGLPRGGGRRVLDLLVYAGWVLPLLPLLGLFASSAIPMEGWLAFSGVLLIAWLGVAAKRLLIDPASMRRMGRRLRRQIRVSVRTDRSYGASLEQLEPVVVDGQSLPLTDSEDARYAMTERLRRILAPFGFTGVLVVVDRVDEPSLISGNPEAMRAVVWPMLRNKFLQMDGLGVKMLLPIELRHALYRESNAFFQEARLDKQNLVDRLSWTGAMLYDLCDARLKACLADGAEPIALVDLFAEDVAIRDVVDALDQMHQPRDAFKFIYQCLAEHCSNVTAEQQEWRVPRLVLDQVRKQQADRVQQLYRGISPA